jgi:S-adenosylmethionine hydrolase
VPIDDRPIIQSSSNANHVGRIRRLSHNPGAAYVSRRIQGKVVEVSSNGDLVTDITPKQWQDIPRSTDTRVLVDQEHETVGIFDGNHEQPAMTLIAIAHGEEPLRLHLVDDSAAMMLGVRSGASVEIRW